MMISNSEEEKNTFYYYTFKNMTKNYLTVKLVLHELAILTRPTIITHK